MYQPHPYKPHVFANSPLDRLDARRKDTGWIEQALQADTTVFLPVWRGRNLLGGDPAAPCLAPLASGIARAQLGTCPWALLGALLGALEGAVRGARGGNTFFALDLSRLEQPLPPGAPGRFEDLRRMGGLLAGDDAAILAHARGLMHWRARTRFCGVCGAGCLPRDAGHVMVCQGCGADHFPRTDPAVIMLVTRTGADGVERALMGMPARLRELRVFTTLAGFVEPGESLEEAVAREVWEEAGVRVANVRYASSQPWPFPASIMLGFTAEAMTEAIDFDPDELAEARWFTREEAAAQEGFMLPPKVSIARRLIENWLQEKPR